jgi:DNA-binding transcriptional LysR family regulator
MTFPANTSAGVWSVTGGCCAPLPGYLQRRGTPQTLDELQQHDCLVIKERDNAFGIWNLDRDGGQENVRVSGPLSSNNGEIVLQWALDGRGVLLRSLWDVKPLLEQGRLVQVLDDYSQSANVWAVSRRGWLIPASYARVWSFCRRISKACRCNPETQAPQSPVGASPAQR